MNNSEILYGAADVLDENEWGQGWSRPVGQLCLVDAIARIVDSETEEFRLSLNAMREHLDISRPLYEWNDEPGRQKHEVVEALRACAVIEEAKEKGYDTTDQPLPVEIPEAAVA